MRAREEEAYQRADTPLAFNTDRAASPFGEALDLKEPESAAAARGLCREVRGECLRENLDGHALPVVGDDDLDESLGCASGRFDVPRRDGDRTAPWHGIGRVSAEVQQREVQFLRVSVEVPQIRGDIGADRDVGTQPLVQRTRQRCEATACDEPADRLGAWSRNVEELTTAQRSSCDRVPHLADDGLSVCGVALALEQPQAAANHSEKVVDVVDHELRHVPDRPRPLRPAGVEHAAGVGLRGGQTQDPGDLAVAPDERNLHAPGRDEAAAIIADAPHPRAECALYSKRDAGAVREHDDILQRRALDHAGEGNVGCLFDLHVGPHSLRSFNGTPTSARTRGRTTTARSLSLWRSKGKSPLAMESIADRYRNG